MINDNTKEIKVPLSCDELDRIILALRMVNKAFKGEIHDDLEEKMCEYSMMAKKSN